jgi:hypothetical protein
MIDLKHPSAGTEPSLGTRLSSRTFLVLSRLVSLAAGRVRRADAAALDGPAAAATSAQIKEWNVLLQVASNLPLYAALFGRRSRRFGRGVEIPAGPLKFKSEKPAALLDDFDRAQLLAAAMGVSGHHFGIPSTVAEPGLATCAARNVARWLKKLGSA